MVCGMRADDDGEPEWTGFYDLSFMSPEELDQLDQGRYLCIDCGRFYSPDGEEGHYGCPTPRSPGDYPPGLLPE